MGRPEHLSHDEPWDRLYLDGEWTAATGEGRLTVADPWSREDLAVVPAATVDDVDRAYAAAREAQSDWAARSLSERQTFLEDLQTALHTHRPSLADLLVAEAGSTTPWRMVEFEFAGGIIDWAVNLEPDTFAVTEHPSSFTGKRNFVERVPAGVVGVIAPWNMPVFLAFRSIAPALVAGNTVVLKPAEETPIIGGLALAWLADEIDLPPGVLNVVPGTGPEAGDAVAASPNADLVCFTGSVDTGRSVARRSVDHLGLPILELGGNTPFVVLPDADLEEAVTIGLAGTFLHQGQLCVAINRHIVHDGIYGAYVDRLVDRAATFATGDPADPATIVGPVINEDQRDRVLSFVADAVDAGATLEIGGSADGLVVEPTVLSEVTNGMSVACTEHFGPVAPVIRYDEVDEAVALANDTEHRLAAAVLGGDLEAARAVADRLEFGMTHVNDIPVHDEPDMPFGGMGEGGLLRMNGEWIVDAMTEPRWITEQHEPRDYLLF